MKIYMLGLYRKDDKDSGGILDVWDNNSPVTFTAWYVKSLF